MPFCISFVPWAFVMAIIVTTVASVSCKLLAVKSFFSRIVYGLTGLMWGSYWLLAVVMSVVAVIGAKKERNKTCFALPFLFSCCIFLMELVQYVG